MTVSLDPSEVRRNETSVKISRAAGRSRFPLRAVLIGGLGSLGLVAFSVGAFSFFAGLADPRARAPRVMPVAAKMPDLKDGLPALVSEDGQTGAQPATTFNLPRPAPVTQAAQPQPAASEPSAPQLRAAVHPADPEAGEAREQTRPAGIARAPKAAPPIQNAAVIVEARTIAPIPPAKAETVRAKAGQPDALASLPPDPAPQRTPEPVGPEAHKPAAKPAAAKPPAQKTASRKAGGTKPVADAAQGTAPPAPPAASDDGDMVSAIPGGRQVRAGLKAIGGLFGGSSDAD